MQFAEVVYVDHLFLLHTSNLMILSFIFATVCCGIILNGRITTTDTANCPPANCYCGNQRSDTNHTGILHQHVDLIKKKT